MTWWMPLIWHLMVRLLLEIDDRVNMETKSNVKGQHEKLKI